MSDHQPTSSLATAALFLFFASSPAGAAEPPADVDECAVLAALDFSEAVGATLKVIATQVAAAGSLPALCRITGTIAPEVGFEAWLPVDKWNGKLLVTGCYGYCGSIRTEPMEDAAARGYATATTDSGHSDQKYPDSRWAYNNPALENDFGHRAVHVTAVLAKALILGFYGDREEHAYFRGCSNGGRQGLVAAQRYPEDFDGIIAGAPWNLALAVPHMIWADRANTRADGQPLLKSAQFELLHRAALEQCDAEDGLVDGVIGDPEACRLTPATLECTADLSRPCLGPEQVAAAQKIYQGAVNSAGQRLYSFGAAPGSEFNWEQGLIGREGKPSFFNAMGQNWLRYHAFEPDPPPDGGALIFDFDKDPARLAPAAERTGFAPDLERFNARDGKLIVYHGWADEIAPPSQTLDYWQKAIKRNGGGKNLNRYARLFMLPGVTHCGGGPGAGDVDYLSALERWVENDEAPDKLIAYRTKDSVSAIIRQVRFPMPGELQMKRPVYPYPDIARYEGKGDPMDPASFVRVRRGEPEKPAEKPTEKPAEAKP